MNRFDTLLPLTATTLAHHSDAEPTSSSAPDLDDLCCSVSVHLAWNPDALLDAARAMPPEGCRWRASVWQHAAATQASGLGCIAELFDVA